MEALVGMDPLDEAGEAPGRHLEARLLDDLPAQGLRQDLGPLDAAPRQRPPPQGRRLSPPDEQEGAVITDRHRPHRDHRVPPHAAHAAYASRGGRA